MENNIEFIHDHTEDGLLLQAIHFESEKKEVCVLFVHGMADSIVDNRFVHPLAKELNNNKIGFFFGHNRGYSHMNDILCSNGKHKRIGSSFEIFEECIYDIDLWLKKVKELGYKKIVIVAHSFGCTKTIYYLSEKGMLVDGLVLASPPDVYALAAMGVPNYQELLKLAEENIRNNEKDKIILGDAKVFNLVSSETFVNKYKKGSKCHNIPVMANPEKFTQLEKIKIPIFAFSGAKEYPIYHQLELLKKKAMGTSIFEYKIIEDTGHTYRDKEKEIAKLILNFIENNI